MADRLVSVDSETKRFPESVRSAHAVDLEDRSTPEGAAVDRVARRAPFEPGGLSDATKAGLAATYAPRFVRDIRAYLNPGESLDLTGSASNHVVFQRAVDALSAEYDAQSGALGVLGFQIFAPEGFYKFSTKLTWKRGVGIAGQSQRTVFLPQGSQSFIDGSYPPAGYSYSDCLFNDFTVDGAAQSSGGTYNTSIKGIFIQYMKRARFENVTVKNTWATGFGVDQLEDAWFINCEANGNGRGMSVLSQDPATSSGHSGFGIGTGANTVEAVSIINCIARDNGMYGIFFEKQQNEELYPNGVRVIGCISSGNWVGFKDCGSTGAVVQGNHFIDNKCAGVMLDGTVLVANAGKDGLVSGNVISGNGLDASAASFAHGGVVLVAAGLGGYTFTGNEIFGNGGAGVSAPATAKIGDRMTFDSNRIHGNTGSGISIASSSKNLTVRNNTIWGNTQTDLLISGADKVADGLILTGNNLRDASVSITQTLDDAVIVNNPGLGAPSNLVLTGTSGGISASWTAPSIVTPTGYTVSYRRAGTTAWTAVSRTGTTTTQSITGLTNGYVYEVKVGTVSDGTSYVTTSASTRSWVVAGAVVDFDTFNRANTVPPASIGSTNGGKAWSSSTWAVENNALRSPDAVEGFAILTASTADYTVAATFKYIPASSVGLLIRYQDTSNWIGAVRSTSTGTWMIQRRTAGTYSVLADSGVQAQSGHRITLRASGGDYTMSINSDVSVTATDVVSTRAGVGLKGASNVLVDDFTISAA